MSVDVGDVSKHGEAMTNRERMYERLIAVHSFPEIYIFKVIGANTEDFITRVVQATINSVGRDHDLEVRTRESTEGRHVSVTLLVHVEDADEVLDAYEMLHGVEGVRFLV